MAMNRETRTRLGAALVLALVFGAGIAVGFVLDRGVAQAAPGAGERTEARSGEGAGGNGWIIDRLDLSDDQQARVDSVLDYYGDRLKELHREYRPRYRELVRGTEEAVRGVLDEKQRARYDSLSEAEKRKRSSDRDSRRD